MVIETTDLVFAVDSIPAALGVTTDMFIVFTCPHDLHTGCAGPAPRPAVLELITRPVATEDELTDAVHAADATALPGRRAVAEK